MHALFQIKVLTIFNELPLFYLSKIKDILHQKIKHAFTGLLDFYWLTILKKYFLKLLFKIFNWYNLDVIDNSVNLLIEHFLKQNLAFYGIYWIPHLMRHCGVYKLEKFFFTCSYIVHDLSRYINNLNQILLFVGLLYRLHFKLNILIVLQVLIFLQFLI